MPVEIKSKKNYKPGELDNIRMITQKPLDELFREGWVMNSAMGRDRSLVDSLDTYGEDIRRGSDIIVVIADRRSYPSVNAVLSSVLRQRHSGYSETETSGGISATGEGGITKESIHMEGAGNSPEVVVFKPSLDPAYYAEVIDKLEGKRGTIIGISFGGEDVSFRAAYSVVKKAVFSTNNAMAGGNPGAEEDGEKQLGIHDSKGPSNNLDVTVSTGRERVYAVCGVRGEGINKLGIGSEDEGEVEVDFLLEDARENNYPLILLEDDAAPELLANTAAVLLPLIAAGVNAKDYLMGFSETVASPDWDREAMLPGFELAEHLKKGAARNVSITTWQENLKSVAHWCRNYLEKLWTDRYDANGASKIPYALDDGAAGESGRSGIEPVGKMGELALLLTSTEGSEDVMLPFFRGCDPDGSLFSLLKTEEGRTFYDDESDGFGLEIERPGAKELGAMMAFLQMTVRLAERITLL